MKKLLTFAGVSALALITAAPDAFAASTTKKYGAYNPQCSTMSGAIQVKFWGLKPGSNGAAATISELYSTTISDAQTPAWGTSLTLDNLKAKITSSIKIGTSTYSSGLTPRGAVLYSLGDSQPNVSLYADNEGLLVTKTTSTWSPATMIGTNAIGSALVDTFSFGLGTSAAFPAVTQANIKTIKEESNNTVINYVIAYAASCVQPTNGTCTLTIKGNGNGGAHYYNECFSGYNGSGFGDGVLMCSTAAGATKCGNITTVVKKSALQKSDTPEWVAGE